MTQSYIWYTNRFGSSMEWYLYSQTATFSEVSEEQTFRKKDCVWNNDI